MVIGGGRLAASADQSPYEWDSSRGYAGSKVDVFLEDEQMDAMHCHIFCRKIDDAN